MKFTTIAILTVTLAAVVSAAPMSIQRRRFGQEHTPEADADFQAMKDLSIGTGHEADAGNLSGFAVRALLAKAPACDQQDAADQLIDIAKKIKSEKKVPDAKKRGDDMIKVAKNYRQLERNTPNVGQPSELCKKAPKNKELKGLVQAQDPTGTGEDTGKGGDNGNGNTGTGGGSSEQGSLTPGQTIKTDDDAFTKPVGGIAPPEIVVNKDGNASVNGDRFLQTGNAIARACDVQKNACFNKFNSTPQDQQSFNGADCENQRSVCGTGTVSIE